MLDEEIAGLDAQGHQTRRHHDHAPAVDRHRDLEGGHAAGVDGKADGRSGEVSGAALAVDDAKAVAVGIAHQVEAIGAAIFNGQPGEAGSHTAACLDVGLARYMVERIHVVDFPGVCPVGSPGGSEEGGLGAVGEEKASKAVDCRPDA